MDFSFGYLSMFPEYYHSADTELLESNILVVEDDPFWQGVIRRNIEKIAAHCNVIFAASAEEAMAILLLGNDFDLVVADQFLEGTKTGYDLWNDCQRKGIHVPFLLTSGNADFQDTFHLPVHFVAKPFVASELRKKLADLLSGHLSDATLMTLSKFPEGTRAIEVALFFAAFILFVITLYRV